MVITCTESAFDFGKSMSTYFHKILGLNRNCRLFELKNACYSGVAGFQMAANFILSQTSPGAKVLVIATDISRFIAQDGGAAHSQDWSFFGERRSGRGGDARQRRALCVPARAGASGYYGYGHGYVPPGDRQRRGRTCPAVVPRLLRGIIPGVQQPRGARTSPPPSAVWRCIRRSEDGQGAHRDLMRRMVREAEHQADFERRVLPGLAYCQRVANRRGDGALAGQHDRAR
jgi:polyketide biosynthesis 3-hydroxy-3-methylglutaryl-CoA synthase-like enzyme PksG